MIDRFVLVSSLVLLAAGCSDKGSEDTGPVNTAPVAEAGDNTTQPADSIVELDGRSSYDAEGDALIYHWTFDSVPAGSNIQSLEMPFVRNDNRAAGTTTFQPDALGTFVVKLEVNDGKLSSVPDFLVVTTQAPDAQPVAKAGDDLSAEVGQVLTLDGSSSFDSEGRALGYEWLLVEAPAVSSATTASISDANTATPSLSIDAKGVYVLNLVVDNGLARSNPDAVVVTATADDSAPVANAGEDQAAEDCTQIQLTGSGSVDPDSDPLEYFWELQSKPASSSASNNSFSDRRGADPTFWADTSGTYNFSLSVSDGTNWSTADALTIDVSERATNTPPVVVINTIPTVGAGEAECAVSGYSYACDDCAEQVATLGDTVAIVDADNDPYQVLWELMSGTGSIEDPSALITSLTMQDLTTTEPYYCNQNQFVLRLTVTDCTGAYTQESTTMTGECCGIPASSSR